MAIVDFFFEELLWASIYRKYKVERNQIMFEQQQREREREEALLYVVMKKYTSFCQWWVGISAIWLQVWALAMTKEAFTSALHQQQYRKRVKIYESTENPCCWRPLNIN